RIRDLSRDRERLVDGQGSARDAVGKRRPLDELHDEKRSVVALLDAVDVRDVGMVQRRQDLRFAAEPRKTIRIVCNGGQQNLDGDAAIQLRIVRVIHSAHPAFTQLLDDAIRADAAGHYCFLKRRSQTRSWETLSATMSLV